MDSGKRKKKRSKRSKNQHNTIYSTSLNFNSSTGSSSTNSRAEEKNETPTNPGSTFAVKFSPGMTIKLEVDSVLAILLVCGGL